MASSNSKVFRHTFSGGLASNLGTLAEVAVGNDGRIDIPFLLRAENVFYQLNGGIKKIGGTVKWNDTVMESGVPVRGIFEYVRSGVAGSPTRQKIAAVGTKLKADDNDGAMADILTGMDDESVVSFTVFEDLLIVSTDADEDPIKYDGTTAQDLGGTPPNFAFCVPHANRLWAAGDRANPSRLYYSSLLESEEWNGVGNSGFLDITPNDGDVIMGIRQFRGQLIVFKGITKGSIHRVEGLEPGDFAVRVVLPRGAPCAGHNSIFEFGNDLGFVCADATIRSLTATDQFGDFNIGRVTLSVEIEDMLQLVTFSSLKRAWAENDPSFGYVLLSLPFNSSDWPNLALMMDYRLERMRYATWTAIDAVSIARMSDPSNSNKLILFAGGSDGFIRKLQQNNHSIDGDDAIPAYFRLPFVDYGTQFEMKTIIGGGLGLQPQGGFSINFSFRRQSQDQQVSVIQGGSDVLGPADFDVFILDESTLAGDQYRTIWFQIQNGGHFREISYEISSTGIDEDMDVQSVHAVIEGASVESYEN